MPRKPAPPPPPPKGFRVQAISPVELFLVLPGKPTTKKTGNQVGYVKNGRVVILPSAEYRDWAREMCQMRQAIYDALAGSAIELPIMVPVRCTAHFYRTWNAGDACGFYTALADILQIPLFKEKGQVRRPGLGVIRDDVQIEQWDGSRLHKDQWNPRIELTLTLLEQPRQQTFWKEAPEPEPVEEMVSNQVWLPD